MSDRGNISPPTKSDIDTSDIDLGDDDKFGFGNLTPDGDISIRYDPNTGVNGSLIVRDEQNSQDKMQIEVGEDINIVSSELNVKGDDTKVRFGADEDVGVEFDPNIGPNGALVVRDLVNSVDFMQFNIGADIEVEDKSLEIANAGDADFYVLTDGSTGDKYRLRGFADETFGFQLRDSSAGVDRNTMKFEPSTGNVLLAQDGSVADPSLAWESDPDTGFIRPSADTIHFVAGGDAEMELTSAGNLNIQGELTETTTV